MTDTTEVLQFHTPCGSMTSVETSQEKWPLTKTFADGVVLGCHGAPTRPACESRCTLYRVAYTTSWKEFNALIRTPGLSEIYS